MDKHFIKFLLLVAFTFYGVDATFASDDDEKEKKNKKKQERMLPPFDYWQMNPYMYNNNNVVYTKTIKPYRGHGMKGYNYNGFTYNYTGHGFNYSGATFNYGGNNSNVYIHPVPPPNRPHYPTHRPHPPMHRPPMGGGVIMPHPFYY